MPFKYTKTTLYIQALSWTSMLMNPWDGSTPDSPALHISFVLLFVAVVYRSKD